MGQKDERQNSKIQKRSKKLDVQSQGLELPLEDMNEDTKRESSIYYIKVSIVSRSNGT